MSRESSNTKMEKATKSAMEMEKHMNTALLWMADAIKDRCEETDKVEEENKKLRKRLQDEEDLRPLILILYILTFLLGIATDRYGFSK